MRKGIIHRRVVGDGEHSFVHAAEAFTAPLHYHAEFELILVTAGEGTEFVGSGCMEYAPGTLTLIGGNVPHLHLCRDGADRSATACELLYFSAGLFPSDLASIPEYRHIGTLLGRSRLGVRFLGEEEVGAAAEAMRTIDRESGVARLCRLLELLDRLGRASRTSLIASDPVAIPVTAPVGEDEPVWRVYRYLAAHFREAVSLDEIARAAGMSPTALCRYFRRRTGKTVFGYLNGLRVAMACRLLGESQRSVAQIAAEVGFGNLSHFHAQFRRITGRTPTRYRQELTVGR